MKRKRQAISTFFAVLTLAAISIAMGIVLAQILSSRLSQFVVTSDRIVVTVYYTKVSSSKIEIRGAIQANANAKIMDFILITGTSTTVSGTKIVTAPTDVRRGETYDFLVIIRNPSVITSQYTLIVRWYNKDTGETLSTYALVKLG